MRENKFAILCFFLLRLHKFSNMSMLSRCGYTSWSRLSTWSLLSKRTQSTISSCKNRIK